MKLHKHWDVFLGCQLRQRMGSSPTYITSHLFQSLAVNLWKSNASMWIARTSIFHPETDGVI